MSFVHLHVHTQYSLLQGCIRVPALMDRVSELSMPAVAMTDTNNLFGAVDFYLCAKKKNVQPIIGCEILFSPEGYPNQQEAPKIQAREIRPRYFHLVLLCKNYQGYQSLSRMLTEAYWESYQRSERKVYSGPLGLVTPENLKQNSQGLISLSGCLRSEITYQLISGEDQSAKERIQWFQRLFGEDFFLEIQDTAIPEQDQANEMMAALGKELGVPLVGTSDCHYLDETDSEAHEVLQCIEQNKNLDFDRPESLVPKEFFLKPSEEMVKRFERFPEAAAHTLEIAKRCDLEFRFKDEKGNPIYHIPDFRPEGVEKEAAFDVENYLREESRKGLEKRFSEKAFEKLVKSPNWAEKKKDYEKRLEDELKMIIRTGFPGYFLIVADFINWAKNNQIPVGPGRGSGAGSLVAYSLRITDIDPIHFNLLFERFINPERISMPDFDVDFCQDRRSEVIDYVTRKYGKENVCQIITFGKLQARAAIKDIGRVLGLSFSETDPITKLIPDELGITLSSALEKEPRLRKLTEDDPRVGKLMDYALRVEGLYRNPGMHAAGVIITNRPVVEYCPLYVGSDGSAVTQFDKDFSEKIGLVKFDFLGLKTLTVIDKAVQLVRQNSGLENFDISNISYEDAQVYQLISSGDTNGVFQVESSGMKDLCTRLKPSSIEDLTAINALYRPGPLGSGMVDEFIERKHGRRAIEYDLPQLEPILKDTYGVILYQEQVMQIARDLAGYSMGQADMLRKAMGKKIIAEMDRHRTIFLEGSQEQEIPVAKAEKIYDLMAKFAQYGFNKSHSAAYAVLTYQTAFLKSYYRAEFMAALMTTEVNSTDKITKYISDARDRGILVLPPNVNASSTSFSVERQETAEQETNAIRFGLEAIKGVGGIAADTIIEAREEKESKSFADVLDFCRSVSMRKVNKKVLEALISAGALDEISDVNRPTLLASIENLVKHATDDQEEKALGQSSLFDDFGAEQLKQITPVESIFKKMEDWSHSQRLLKEKQVVGFYVSGHPMDSWQSICDEWLGWNTQVVEQQAQRLAKLEKEQGDPGGFGYSRPVRRKLSIGGVLTDFREVTVKKGRNAGRRMSFGYLEDLNGKLEVAVFADDYEKLEPVLKQAAADAEPVVVHGELDVRGEVPKILPKQIQWANQAYEGKASKMVLQLQPSKIHAGQLRDLKQKLLEFRGNCPVQIEFKGKAYATTLELPTSLKVVGSPQLVRSINQIFGGQVVRLLGLR